MHKTQVQMDERPQYKSNHTEPDRGESGKYPSMHGHRRPLSKYNPSSKDNKSINKQMGPPETEKLLSRKKTVNKKKRQPTEREDIFTNPTSGKGLISNIY